jgi:hypothetical protein
VSVRPEFGPTLPALLEARGLSRRAIAGGAVALVVLAIVAFLGVRALDDSEHLVVDGPPEFNLVYAPSILSEEPPREDELVRLEGSRPNLSVELTVRAVEVPAGEGEAVVGGYLPILAEKRLADLDDLYGPVGVIDEGKSRINGQPGYQIGFRSQRGEELLFGRDAYVFEDEEGATDGLLLSMRRTIRGKQTTADEEFFDKVKEAFASIALGRSQP